MNTISRLVVCAACLLLLITGCSVEPHKMPGAVTVGRAPNTKDAFNFVILSDRTGGHIPGEFEKAIDEVNLLKPDFVMCVGDLVEGYTDDEALLAQQWDEVDAALGKLDAPFHYCAGNHDMIRAGRAVYLRRHGTENRAYYSVNYKDCHFVVLDSYGLLFGGIAPAEQQLAWLKADLLKAKDASHVFVFYHHPLWQDTKLWPRLAEMLPKEKTTIFNGHTHAMSYQLADGIPTYVLCSMAAKYKEAPGQFRMFVRVAVDKGEPTIALVPVHGLKPTAYIEGLTQVNQMMETLQVDVPAEGGPVRIRTNNSGKTPARVEYELAREGVLGGAAVDVAGSSGTEITLDVPPATGATTRPTLQSKYAIPGSIEISSVRELAVSQKGVLGSLSGVQVDGKLDEWEAVPALAMDRDTLVFRNKEGWRGAGDASCTVRAAVTGDSLAVAIAVSDDQIVTDRSEAWANDSVEVCWDVRPEGQRSVKMGDGAGQVVLVPADESGAAKAIAWYPAGVKSAKPAAGLVSASARTAEGYVVEFAIPLAELGISGGTAKEGLVRLAVALNDRDQRGKQSSFTRMSITGTGDFARSTEGYARFIRP